jgi:hypothetical protein
MFDRQRRGAVLQARSDVFAGLLPPPLHPRRGTIRPTLRLSRAKATLCRRHPVVIRLVEYGARPLVVVRLRLWLRLRLRLRLRRLSSSSSSSIDIMCHYLLCNAFTFSCKLLFCLAALLFK